jgi:hypothetical protein
MDGLQMKISAFFKTTKINGLRFFSDSWNILTKAFPEFGDNTAVLLVEPFLTT